jgi:hypothetical protein
VQQCARQSKIKNSYLRMSEHLSALAEKLTLKVIRLATSTARPSDGWHFKRRPVIPRHPNAPAHHEGTPYVHVGLQPCEPRRCTMCDYSLQNVKSRPAAVGDKLVKHNFGAGTRGLAASESLEAAVCLLPGTEIAFPNGLLITHRNFLGWPKRSVTYTTAIFRQINKQSPGTTP